jgi:flagellar biosynthetic protein FlhB
MADEQDAEKSEEATQGRREEFRKRGQVVQSRELGTTLFILAALGAIFALSKFFFKELYETFQFAMGPAQVEANTGEEEENSDKTKENLN